MRTATAMTMTISQATATAVTCLRPISQELTILWEDTEPNKEDKAFVKFFITLHALRGGLPGAGTS